MIWYDMRLKYTYLSLVLTSYCALSANTDFMSTIVGHKDVTTLNPSRNERVYERRIPACERICSSSEVRILLELGRADHKMRAKSQELVDEM